METIPYMGQNNPEKRKIVLHGPEAANALSFLERSGELMNQLNEVIKQHHITDAKKVLVPRISIEGKVELFVDYEELFMADK